MRNLRWLVLACLALSACARTPPSIGAVAGAASPAAVASGQGGVSGVGGASGRGGPAGGVGPTLDDLGRAGTHGGHGASRASINLYACTTPHIADELIQQSYGLCPDEVPVNRAHCVQEHIDKRVGFVVTWDVTGSAGPAQTAMVGVPHGAEYVFYRIDYDRAGFVGTFHPEERWTASWVECLSFRVASSCNSIEGCFECVENETRACGCGREDDPLAIHCGGFTARPILD